MISKSNVRGIWKRSKFMTRGFASSTEQEIEKWLKQKDSEKQKKAVISLLSWHQKKAVISLSLRLRLITVTSTLIIPDIAETESNNCLLNQSGMIIRVSAALRRTVCGDISWRFHNPRGCHHRSDSDELTLMMTSAQVLKTSVNVTTNSHFLGLHSPGLIWRY